MKIIDLNLEKETSGMKNLIYAAILLLFVISSISVFSQKNNGFIDSREQAEGWYLPVFGQVFEDGKKCEDASVKVYLENEELGTFPISKKGGFRLELDLDNFYTIEVSKNGFITKRVSVDTHMDENVVDYAAYDCFINLHPVNEVTGVDTDYFDFPAAIVRYDAELGGFYHSDHYLAHINEMLDKAVQQASQ